MCVCVCVCELIIVWLILKKICTLGPTFDTIPT